MIIIKYNRWKVLYLLSTASEAPCVHDCTQNRIYSKLRLRESSTRPAKAEPEARHSGANSEIRK